MNKNKLEDRGKCPLCGSLQSAIYIAFPEIPVLQCSQCSFLYSGWVLSAAELFSYYQDNYGSMRHLQGQVVNAAINAWVTALLVDMTGVKRVLDIGTGYGFLLDALTKRYKVEAAGVELSQQEAEYAVKKLGLNVINLPIDQSGLQIASYDLVTVFEVIEHILDPISFIREITQYVKPGGYVLILTDNFRSRMAQSLGPGFPKWIPHTHISHFSPLTLQKAIEAGGLSVVRSKSYTPWEIMARDAYYRIRRIRKTPAEAFNLELTLKSEMSGGYRLFALRRLINRLWVGSTLTSKMDGDMMYFLARRDE
ncbi:class I SAM-dependent methyltransferase [Candidatus Villigracilis saccharophilus]|uniref:class I SAM-dependent methyltransferase n=1 Tax=Candidatus Villigracilis saccharophilus TaxID=3140684 RepID=UPI0031357FC6|nr:class I SAM-dependent methyltransferase [Anaerolineales bacterium]